jgi:hypothetical protein
MDMQILAWVAAVLVFSSFFMQTIVPLRTLAIASNIVFICYALLGVRYGVFDKVLPILVLHVCLLPLNIVRLRQVKATIHKYREFSSEVPSLDILIPYMTHVSASKGDVLFAMGDVADDVYLIRKGRVLFPEVGKTAIIGEFFGEVGVFSEHRRRTTSAICENDIELLKISGDKVIELFYQDARFALVIVRALSRYLSAAPLAGPSPIVS